MGDQDSSVNNETQKPLLTFISLGSKGRLVVSTAPSKPKTERSVSTIDQSPVRFSVYHGQVLEIQSAQVPAVYGAGRSFLGSGSSYVETAIVRNTSVWTRERDVWLLPSLAPRCPLPSPAGVRMNLTAAELLPGHGRCYRAEALKHGQRTLAPLKVKSQPQRQRQSLLADRRHEPGSGGLPEGAAHTKQSSHHWRQRFNVRQSICSASLIRRARPGFSP